MQNQSLYFVFLSNRSPYLHLYYFIQSLLVALWVKLYRIDACNLLLYKSGPSINFIYLFFLLMKLNATTSLKYISTIDILTRGNLIKICLK